MMFANLSERWTDDADGPVFDVPRGWGQGRATFGGMVVAAAVCLGRRHTDRPLRIFQSQLLAPVAPGPLRGRVRVLREGRTTTVIRIDLEQEGRLAASVSLTYGIDRPAATTVTGPPRPDWSAPDQYPVLPYVEGATPEFTRKIEFRWAEGHVPFQGGTAARIGGYVSFRPEEPPSLEGIVALLDAWPTPTLSILQRPAPSSSVTWTAHLVGPPRPGPYAFRYETVAASDGLSISVGHAWAGDGSYLGFTEQAIAVFDG